MIERGVGPIDTIKALRNGAGVPLGEGKEIVDRLLPPEWQRANERFRDEAMKAILEDHEK